MIVNIDQEMICSIQFQPHLIYLKPRKTYSKTKLKNSGYKSPCFSSFCIGNSLDKYFPIQTLL
jgi:hypothetical protein